MIEISPYVEKLLRVSDELLKPEVLLSTGALTGIVGLVGRLAWAAATTALSWLHSWHLRTISRHTIALARKRLPFDHHLLKPSCLIIRYGTDPYVERLASDRERQDGRLQNRVIRLPIREHQDGSTTFRLRIPVHRRLGTQFKCFVDVGDPSKVQEVLAFLSKCPSISSPGCSSSPLHPQRIYFLLSTFDVVQSIDGHDNNMCFPE